MDGPISLPLITNCPVACLSYRMRTSGGNAVTLNSCCVLMGGSVPLEELLDCGCCPFARSTINFWNSGVSVLFTFVVADGVVGVAGVSSVVGSVPHALRSVGVNSCWKTR